MMLSRRRRTPGNRSEMGRRRDYIGWIVRGGSGGVLAVDAPAIICLHHSCLFHKTLVLICHIVRSTDLLVLNWTGAVESGLHICKDHGRGHEVDDQRNWFHLYHQHAVA